MVFGKYRGQNLSVLYSENMLHILDNHSQEEEVENQVYAPIYSSCISFSLFIESNIYL